MSLSAAMQRALDLVGYTAPTPIQAGLIPPALDGRDVLGQARTGTGKTAAFLIPLIEWMELPCGEPEPQALVVVPTRELAAQVHAESVKLAQGQKLRSIVLCGGKPLRGQAVQLQRGVDLVIGTPGRLLDHIARGTLNLDFIEAVVLDEADRMLDIGFRPDIEKILRKCPKDRQTLLLSATVPNDVERLAQRYMRDPVKVNMSTEDVAATTVEQFYITVEPDQKFDTLVKLMERENPQQVIVFCRTKRGTDKVARRLEKTLRNVAALHGDMAQRVRDRVMEQFRSGDLRCLVATDVVGRGIDVSGISHIINYDIPQFCDDYVHRVGRTGRMGRTGVAFTFVSRSEGSELTSIEMRINQQLQNARLDGPARSKDADERGKETDLVESPEADLASSELRNGNGSELDSAPVEGETAENGSAAPVATEKRKTGRFRRWL